MIMDPPVQGHAINATDPSSAQLPNLFSVSAQRPGAVLLAAFPKAVGAAGRVPLAQGPLGGR